MATKMMPNPYAKGAPPAAKTGKPAPKGGMATKPMPFKPLKK